MKRAITSIALVGFVASLLLTVSAFRGDRSGIVPKVHAQENDGHKACSNASLNGSYGFYRTGTRSDGPVAAVGITTYDGVGTITVRQTIRRNGVTTADLFTSPAAMVPYEVDPDCAGRLLNPDGSVAAHIVVVDGGKEIFFVSIAPGVTATGVAKKINSHRNHEED